MYQYGYYISGYKVILGTVSENEYLEKKKEIDWANKIDPESKWFIEAVS